MEMIAIEGSPVVKELGYDSATKTMRIVYTKTDAGTFDYAPIPVDVYNAILAAPKKGIALSIMVTRQRIEGTKIV